MKNTLKIDFEKQVIVMDRTFAKMAENTRSVEYAELQRVRQDNPTFRVLRRTIKKNPNKKTYKGLTYEFMVKYIIEHEKPEDLKMVLDEFNSLREVGAVCGKGLSYPVIKKWFLVKYPEFENFGEEIDTYDDVTKVVKMAT